MNKSLVDLAKEYSAAWAEHDPDAIAAMHTDDSVFQLHDIHAPATGREAVRDLIGSLFAATPDLRFALKRVHFGTEHFVSEYVMSGTAEGKPFGYRGRRRLHSARRLGRAERQLLGLARLPTTGGI